MATQVPVCGDDLTREIGRILLNTNLVHLLDFKNKKKLEKLIDPCCDNSCPPVGCCPQTFTIDSFDTKCNSDGTRNFTLKYTSNFTDSFPHGMLLWIYVLDTTQTPPKLVWVPLPFDILNGVASGTQYTFEFSDSNPSFGDCGDIIPIRIIDSLGNYSQELQWVNLCCGTFDVGLSVDCVDISSVVFNLDVVVVNGSGHYALQYFDGTIWITIKTYTGATTGGHVVDTIPYTHFATGSVDFRFIDLDTQALGPRTLIMPSCLTINQDAIAGAMTFNKIADDTTFQVSSVTWNPSPSTWTMKFYKWDGSTYVQQGATQSYSIASTSDPNIIPASKFVKALPINSEFLLEFTMTNGAMTATSKAIFTSNSLSAVDKYVSIGYNGVSLPNYPPDASVICSPTTVILNNVILGSITMSSDFNGVPISFPTTCPSGAVQLIPGINELDLRASALPFVGTTFIVVKAMFNAI